MIIDLAGHGEAGFVLARQPRHPDRPSGVRPLLSGEILANRAALTVIPVFAQCCPERTAPTVQSVQLARLCVATVDGRLQTACGGRPPSSSRRTPGSSQEHGAKHTKPGRTHHREGDGFVCFARSFHWIPACAGMTGRGISVQTWKGRGIRTLRKPVRRGIRPTAFHCSGQQWVFAGMTVAEFQGDLTCESGMGGPQAQSQAHARFRLCSARSSPDGSGRSPVAAWRFRGSRETHVRAPPVRMAAEGSTGVASMCDRTMRPCGPAVETSP
jgi:hypothetical protein